MALSRVTLKGWVQQVGNVSRVSVNGWQQQQSGSVGPPLPNPVWMSEMVMPFSTSPGAVPSGGTSGDVAVNVADGILFIVR